MHAGTPASVLIMMVPFSHAGYDLTVRCAGENLGAYVPCLLWVTTSSQLPQNAAPGLREGSAELRAGCSKRSSKPHQKIDANTYSRNEAAQASSAIFAARVCDLARVKLGKDSCTKYYILHRTLQCSRLRFSCDMSICRITLSQLKCSWHQLSATICGLDFQSAQVTKAEGNFS